MSRAAALSTYWSLFNCLAGRPVIVEHPLSSRDSVGAATSDWSTGRVTDRLMFRILRCDLIHADTSWKHASALTDPSRCYTQISNWLDRCNDIDANGEQNRRNLMLATWRSAPDHLSLAPRKQCVTAVEVCRLELPGVALPSCAVAEWLACRLLDL